MSNTNKEETMSYRTYQSKGNICDIDTLFFNNVNELFNDQF